MNIYMYFKRYLAIFGKKSNEFQKREVPKTKQRKGEARNALFGKK